MGTCRKLFALAPALLCAAPAFGQTTQGLISGRVVNSVTGKAIPSANVGYIDSASGVERTATTDVLGFYCLPLLSPGTYRLAVTAPGFQSQEVQELELFVASRIDVTFHLRPISDIWEAGEYKSVFLPGSKAVITFFGPDLDTTHSLLLGSPGGSDSALEATLSYLIDPGQLSDLPLSGRNVYELLLFQPGVTSGLSVNGQRPSSGLFLLDGLDSNTNLGPEFLQEYRVSTNNFSAEFGRATGFVANAITRSGSNAFHGLVYGYINNRILNANAFQSNFNGFPRQEHREYRAGFAAGGPLIRNKAFFFVGYESFRSRTAEYPFSFQVPVLENFERCPLAAGGQALTLLEQFRPPLTKPLPGPACDNLSAPYSLSIPIAINRGFSVARIDHLLRGGRDRLMGRVLTNRETDPYAIFSLYPDFTSPRNQASYSTGLTLVSSLGAKTTTEARFAWLLDTDSLPRRHTEVPNILVTRDGGKVYSQGISLPGISDSITTYRTRRDLLEFGDSTILTRGRHVITFGGSFYLELLQVNANYFQPGEYQFSDLQSFAQDRASTFLLSLARDTVIAGGPYSLGRPDRDYDRTEFDGFVEDSFRAGSRLTFNFGLRCDSFGAIRDTGAQDAYILPGKSGSARDTLPTARFVFPGKCCHLAFSPDRSDWAARIGGSYDLTGTGRYILRAAYGDFYDRQPNMGTTNNSQEVVTFFSADPLTPNYSQLNLGVLSNLRSRPSPFIPLPVLIQTSLLAPRVHSWFAGFEHLLTGNLAFELNHTGAAGTNLLTGDRINRRTPAGTDDSRLNPALPDISYQSNSGYSHYTALTALLRYRTSRLLFQAAYTWGHSIDNQSTPSGFLRQFDSNLDRGASDFDQRQNLVAYSVWRMPTIGRRAWQRAALGGWQAATLMGLRSGFPFNVVAGLVPGIPACSSVPTPGNEPVLNNNRPSVLPGISPTLKSRINVPGGVQLLDPAAFCDPGDQIPGNLGRNSLRGPGFWNIDASVGKSFALRWLGEAGKIQFRADLFNVFNHANLGSPQVAVTSVGTFGQSFYGMSPAPPGSVSVVPLDEAPRRIELQLRIFF